MACSDSGGGVTVADKISPIACSVSTVFCPPGLVMVGILPSLRQRDVTAEAPVHTWPSL